MSLEIATMGPQITGSEIDAFEARIGRALPADYRAFLLKYNGGQPSFHVIRNPQTGDIGVNIFYGIRDTEYFDIDAEYRSMQGRWPNRFLSIAIDDCGNAFCISLGPPDYGSVYFWNHEEEAEEGEEPTELNLYHLADSFSQFWNRIEPIDRDEYLAENDARFAKESDSPRIQRPTAPGSNGERS